VFGFDSHVGCLMRPVFVVAIVRDSGGHRSASQPTCPHRGGADEPDSITAG